MGYVIETRDELGQWGTWQTGDRVVFADADRACQVAERELGLPDEEEVPEAEWTWRVVFVDEEPSS